MTARTLRGGLALVVVLTLSWPRPGAAQTRSMTLDEAIDLALQAQPAMVQARGQVTSAEAARLQSYGSWLPDVSLGSGYSTSSTTRFDDATQRTVSGSATSYSANLNASVVVFDGLSRVYDGRAASADARAAGASLVNQRFQTVLQTKQAFFNALAAEELVRVSETQIDRALEQLKVAREKLLNGTATRSDTLRSTVEVANASLQRLNAQTQLRTAEANLARLTGIEGSVRAVGEGELFTIAEIDTAAVREEALSRSPAINQADAQAAVAAAQYSAVYGQYLPRVTASYRRSWAGNEFIDLDPSWSARLSLSWPLFNGFTRELNRTRSAVNRDNARAQAQDARRQVNAQLTQQLAALAAAQARMQIALASRAASDEDMRVQRERYRLGAATIVEVLSSQVNLDQAEVDVVQARLDYQVAKAEIEALIGREL